MHLPLFVLIIPRLARFPPTYKQHSTRYHAEMHPTPGRIEVIVGPMFSGKSEELIRRLKRARIAPLYLKIRDRQSYEFALASAAVALHLEGGLVKQARIALGGVATVPWRAREAEAALVGKPVDEGTAANAARVAFAGSAPRRHNAYKVALGQKTVVRALLEAATMEG